MSLDNPTIQRCPHDEENPYLQVSRALIRDNRISPECRWLIIFLLANKDSWKIYVKKLIADLKGHFGKDKIYALINEAIDIGYIKREEFIVNGLTRTRYFVSEAAKFKNDENPKKRKSLILYPRPDFQDPANQDPENTDSKEEIIDKKKKREEILSIVSQKKWGEFVQMSEEDFLKLVKIYSEPVVLEIFQSINDYCTNSRPKGYKDYTAAFRTFHKNYRAKQENSSWNKKNYQSKSNNFKNTSSERDLLEPVVLGSISLEDILKNALSG